MLSTTTTKYGFVGDVGRWQQRLGIAVEGDDGVGGGGGGGYQGSGCHLSPPATTATDLMDDGVLQEAFAARGRHKKSPVLAHEARTDGTHACCSLRFFQHRAKREFCLIYLSLSLGFPLLFGCSVLRVFLPVLSHTFHRQFRETGLHI